MQSHENVPLLYGSAPRNRVNNVGMRSNMRGRFSGRSCFSRFLFKYQRESAGRLFDFLLVLMALAFVCIVVVESYRDGPTFALGVVLITLNLIFSLDTMFGFVLTNDRVSHFLKFRTILSILFIFTTWLALIIPPHTFNLHVLGVFIFTSPLSVVYLYFKIRMLMRSKDVSQRISSRVTQQLILLGFSLASLVLTSALYVMAFQRVTEIDPISFDTALYFVVVTISTVGYGDVKLSEVYGRIVVMVLILVTLLYIPHQINELMVVIEAQPKFSRPINSSIKGHVIVTGDVDELASIHLFLDQFYSSDHGIVDQEVVILGKGAPSDEVILYLSDPFYRKMVRWVTQSSHVRDVQRTRGRHASAVFVLSSNRNQTQSSDNKAILQAMMFENVNPETQTLIQVSKPASKLLSSADVVLCVSELQMGYLALSTVSHGSSTLISALVHTWYKQELLQIVEGEAHWMQEYAQGLGNEFYCTYVPQCLDGLPFCVMANMVYQRLGVIPIATGQQDGSVCVKPMRHRVQANELIYVIAEDQGLAELVANLEMPVVDEPSSFDPVGEPEEHATDAESETHTPKVSSAENVPHDFVSHVVVVACGPSLPDGLDLFLNPLFLAKEGRDQVCILVDELPSDNDMRQLQSELVTGTVVFVAGSSLQFSDLQRAGVERAGALILLAPVVEEISDANNILTLVVCEKYNLDIPIVAELAASANFSLVSPKPSPVDANKKEITHLSPAFASGKVFCDDAFDAVLVATFHIPALPELLHKLMRCIRREPVVRQSSYGSLVRRWAVEGHISLGVYVVSPIPYVNVNPAADFVCMAGDFLFVV